MFVQVSNLSLKLIQTNITTLDLPKSVKVQILLGNKVLITIQKLFVVNFVLVICFFGGEQDRSRNERD